MLEYVRLLNPRLHDSNPWVLLHVYSIVLEAILLRFLFTFLFPTTPNLNPHKQLQCCKIKKIGNGCELKVPLKQRMFKPIRLRYDLVHDLRPSISLQHHFKTTFPIRFIVLTYHRHKYVYTTTFLFFLHSYANFILL